MNKTFLIFNFMVATTLVQPVMAQSTLEQWQKLMPNSGTQVPRPSEASKGRFVDPYDAEMLGAKIAARRGQWSEAWQSIGHGLRSLFDPELNAARLEMENEKKRR